MSPILFLFSMLIFSGVVSAQKTWDVGNNGGSFWPVNATGYGATTTIDGLTIVPGSGTTNMGVVEANLSGTYADGFTAINRFKTGGSSSPTVNMPTKRYVSFPVSGPCTVKVWFKCASAGSRNLSVSDGTTVYGTLNSAVTTDLNILTATCNVSGTTTLYVYGDNSFNINKISWAPSGVSAPALTPDTSANSVDNNLDISFTDNAAWRSAITAVKIGTTTLTSGTDYVLSAGNLQLKPSGLNTLLTTSGSKSVSIIATGYAPASVTQIIIAGTPTSNSTVSINPALAKNTTSTVTCTAKDQYNNLVSGYAFKFNISRTDTNASVTEAYTLNSVAYTSNAAGVSTGVTDVNGIATFSVAVPAVVNANDGLSIQVTLADATTNIGTAFSFINVLTPQTITFGALSPVAYSLNGTFALNGTSSSGLPVSYSSSNPLVATVSGSTVTIVGVGTTSITATQAGDATYDSAQSVIRDLVINCGSTSYHDTTVSNCGSYTWANNGQTYSTNGSFTIIGTTTNCVTERLFLTISGSTNITNVTVCEPYTWANTGQTYSVSGVYDGTTTNCVLEKLNLTINSKNSFYVDADGDGFGAGTAVLLCETSSPSGYAANSTDCDDSNATIWRTGTFFQDVDGDGYTDKSTSLCYGSTTPAGFLTSASAPNKVWDFSNTTLSTGIGATDVVVNQLGLYPTLLTPGTVNMGAITGSIVTFAATATTDAFGPTVTRLQLNGGGSTTTSMPTQRYAYFDVDGPCRVLVWFRTGGSGTRNLFVTDGTNVVNSLGSTNSSENLILKANYAGGPGRLYIYGDQSCNIYKIQVTGANVTTQSIVPAPTTLNFVANTTSNSVDNNIDITFTDNAAWRQAVTAVKIGAVTLTPTTDYSLTAGHLLLKPSGGNAAITIPGSKKVNILANGYSSSLSGVTQTITAGTASSVTSVVAISAALAQNSTRTITCTAKDQFGNAVAGYAFKYLATITNNDANTTESYIIDGTAQSINASNTITAVTNSSGVAIFTVTLPSEIDSNDGISVQVKLNDGTNLGNAFSFTKTATPIVTVVDNCGTSVLSTNASGTLLWSTGETSSSITVSSAGNYTVTSTVNDITSLQGTAVATPIFTAAPSASAQSICTSGTIANLVASGTANQWYSSATGGSALASDVALATGTYYVSQTANGCESPRSDVSVTVVNGLISQPINTSICKVIGGSAVLSVVSVNPNATYQWQAQAPTATLESTWANVANPATGTAIYTGATSSELSIRKSTLVLPATLTKYRVKVTGTCGVETSNVVTLTDVALPTEVIGAITSNTATTTGFAAATLAVGPYVGTSTQVSYRIPAFTGSGLTYYWTVPAGVSIVGQPSGVTSVTQVGADANVLNVNFNNVSSGIGTIGSITVQAQNASGCKTAAPKSIVLTKALPAAPTTLVMTDGISATAITNFAKYVGTSTTLTLTAAASATATSYDWELPTGVTQLTGSNTNVITVNFAGVTNSNTDSYTTAAGVVTKVVRIGVKSRNGVGVSTTSNAALINPTTSSTAKLLTLSATAPAAPSTLVLTNGVTTTAVTVVSKYVGTTSTFKLTAGASVLANSYSWELPSGVNRTDINGVAVNGLTSTDPFIYVNFANVPSATTSLVFGVKAVNGIGSSSTVNAAPNEASTAKLLKVTAGVPVAPATLVLTDPASATSTVAVTVVSKYIGTTKTLKLTAATSLLANSYSWELPTGVNRTDSSGVAVSGLTSTDPFIYVNFSGITPISTTTISLYLGVKAVNGVGTSVSVNVAPNVSNTAKLLTVTAGLPVAVSAVTGSLSVCNRSEGYSYTITAPVGANYYVITAPVGSVVSSTNGISGNTPNVLTTTDLTFNVVYSGTAAFPTTDKSLLIKSGNAFGLSATAKALVLTKVATCPTTVKLEISSDEFNASAYPNPFAENFKLDVKTSSEEALQIKVYDMLGNLVENRILQTTEIEGLEVGANLSTGVYNVVVSQGVSVKTLRVIKR